MMRNMSNFDKVGEFMESFGQEIKESPNFPTPEIALLRYNLIAEELDEFSQAIVKNDLTGVADALSDLLYVVYGAGHAFGINLDLTFNIVHASNMSKLGEDGKPIYREDGKIMKGPNYTPPDLSIIID